MSPSATSIVLNYVCPGLGAVMASAMFAAPVGDLKKALASGDLGNLNALPWIFMTGNCLGWVAYGYYIRDAFVLAGNMPGLVLSVWLNMGAIKIQYYARLAEQLQKEQLQPLNNNRRARQEEEHWDGDVANEEDAVDATLDLDSSEELVIESRRKGLLVAVPHERLFFQMIIAWVIVLVWVGWVWPPPHPETIVGIIVNVNLVFFYGAPLQTLWQVVRTGVSDSIHRPTMVMNWTNTSFWLAYAVAQRNFVIGVPNFIGLLLGIAQGVLCLFYPSSSSRPPQDVMEPIPLDEPMEEHTEDAAATVAPVQEETEEPKPSIRQRKEGQPAKWTMV